MFKITNKLKKEILNSNFIILGETHGAKENLDVAKYFINFLIDQNIPLIFGIEWPANLDTEVNNYIKKNKSILDWRAWAFSKSPDGRISKEHLKFIDWLKKKQILMKCFDESGKNWNDRDERMAMSMINIHKEYKKQKIIALMGNLHAKKHSFNLNNKVCRPLVSYLPKNKTISFKISYLFGRYFNIFLKNIEPNKNTKIENKKSKITKSKDNIYDYEIILKKATPISILDKKNIIYTEK